MTKELMISFVGHILIIGSFVVFSTAFVKETMRPIFHEIYWIQIEPLVENNSQEASGITTASVLKIAKRTEKKEKTTVKSQQNINSLAKIPGSIGIKLSDKIGKESYYLELMLKKIANNWENPLRNLGVSLQATVCFVIKKTGEISCVKLEKSSGNSIFDYSVERAVINTKILPPLDGEFSHLESLIVHLEFEQKQ
ncbi:MAG: energy transducer TonB [candidate division WOR-3 bacterium]